MNTNFSNLILLLLTCDLLAAPMPIELGRQEERIEPEYVISIDAGSTGSRMFIYEYTKSFGRRIPQIRIAEGVAGDPNTAWIKKVTPGLGSFAGDEAGAAAYMEDLLAFAYEKLGEKVFGNSIPVLFEATGGFRRLSEAHQTELLEIVRRSLEASLFEAASVNVIDGQREGIYGWLGINYLLNNLSHESQKKTVGLFEMGGHSLQVTFEPNEDLKDHGVKLQIGPHDYTLYSHSYPGYGESTARESWSTAVCEISDRSIRSDFDECRDHILQSLEAKHHIDAHGGLDGVYQPEIRGNIVGVDNIAETAKFLPLGAFSNDELVVAGREICRMAPNVLKENFPRKSEQDIDRACFDAAYISAIMTGYGEHSHFRGLGLEDKAEVVHGIEFINDKPISWTIGSVLYYLTQPQAEGESQDEDTEL